MSFQMKGFDAEVIINGRVCRAAYGANGVLSIEGLPPAEAVAALERLSVGGAPAAVEEKPEAEPAKAAPPPLAIVPPPPKAERAPEPAKEEAKEEPAEHDELTEKLIAAPRLRDIVNVLMGAGFRTVDDILEECTKAKPHVPILRRMTNFESRVRQAAELLVQEDEAAPASAGGDAA